MPNAAPDTALADMPATTPGEAEHDVSRAPNATPQGSDTAMLGSPEGSATPVLAESEGRLDGTPAAPLAQ
ncbi:MAG: hypothetical protein ACTS5I_08610, partial [Rhodanobacter sp.]